MDADPRCALVIPTFNGAHLLSSCLEALFAHPPECEWRVIVVDDASSDGTAELFAEVDERVTMIARQQNGGFAEACNHGAREAGEVDFLVFLNNDTVPLPGWLDTLVDEVRAHPNTAAVGSRLLYPDGTIQHAGVAIGHDGWPHHLYAGLPGEHPAVTRPKRVVAATAACLLVRRQVFADLDGFDTAFLNGYEDIDLCLRMGELGHEIRYCPDSVLYHLESVTRWEGDESRHVEHNSRLYAERWRDRVAPDDFEHYLADGLIKPEYGERFPVRLSISPLLATVQRETEEEDRLEHLLTVRTDQVLELQALRTRAALERRTLPALLEQDAAAELEIVAIDSASRDDSVNVLKEFDATVIAIDAAEFDHGLTRNLLAQHAQGDVLVYLTQRSRPQDEHWLAPLLDALDADPGVAGVTSRVLPYPDADPLTRRDGGLDPSGSAERSVKRIEDWGAYAAMPVEERRLLLNFHTVSAAIRADVLREHPFRSVQAIGEDLLWAREVIEDGLALVHEPASKVFHSHEYSLREWLMRNVDDGIANREINGRSLGEEEADALVRGMIASDWTFLRDELGLDGEELERWLMQAALRRAAQTAGQWLGVNYEAFPPEAVEAFSRVANSRRDRS
jgi:GT2 family glycosyltransferase